MEANKQKLVDYLRKSLFLKDPKIENDEAYKYTDEDLWEIIEITIPSHNPNYTWENYPENELQFLVMLSRKEVYYRLATASAPFYPLTAEGASLRKDYRFDHYMTLIRRIEIEYSSMWEKFESGRGIEVGEIILSKNHLTKRNYELAGKPSVRINIDEVRGTSVDISWTKFNPSKGKFEEYRVYYSKYPVYDEYEDKIEGTLVAKYDNIHRNKCRIKDLEPNTEYYILIESKDINSLKGFSQEKITTLV